MVTGVTDGYAKTLEIVGVGYRVTAKGKDLEFALGFSHPVLGDRAGGHHLPVETPTRFVVEGIDKQQVGEVAANIRKLRKPDPYKGKGVRYRARVSAARPERLVSKPWLAPGPRAHVRSRSRTAQRWRCAPGVTCGSARRSRAAPARPRLVVNRSSKNIFVQLIDDVAGHTLASASTLEATSAAPRATRRARARQVGKLIAERATGRGRRRPWSSTAVATRTTAGSPPSPTAPAKADSALMRHASADVRREAAQRREDHF